MTEGSPVHSFNTPKIRVLLVCQERVIRAALRALIDGQDGTKVIGEIEHVDTALEAILTERPDVTLLDPDHYGGRPVAEMLQAVMTRTRIILLTGNPESTTVSEALGNGAVGLVLKQQAPEVLIKAITKVHEGELWLDRAATSRLLAELTRTDHLDRNDPETERAELLTRRERQVISLVGEGLRNSQIAARLRISEVTVRNHLTSTFRKLELENRFQLVIYAFQNGLATLPVRMSSPEPAAHRQPLDYRQKTS